MAFVLDCSVALAWVLPDEASDTADQLLDTLLDDFALVPELWPLEVSNVLLIARRRQRLTSAELGKAIDSLIALPLEIDKKTSEMALRETFKIAEKLGITSYDAAYLELAARVKLPLATLDKGLAQAAKTAKIPLVSLEKRRSG